MSNNIKLTVRDNHLCTPFLDATPGIRRVARPEDPELLFIDEKKEPHFINWPMPNYEHLRQALREARDTGYLPRECAEVAMPDGAVLDFDKGHLTEPDFVLIKIPREHWQTLEQTLNADANAGNFEPELREEIQAGLNSYTLLDPQGAKCYVIVQQGGTIDELYLHTHPTHEEAVKDQSNCGNTGAYATSPVTAIPEAYADIPGLMDHIQDIVRSSANLEVRGD